MKSRTTPCRGRRAIIAAQEGRSRIVWSTHVRILHAMMTVFRLMGGVYPTSRQSFACQYENAYIKNTIHEC